MAIDLSGGNPNMDYAQAEQTYRQFILLTKVMIAGLVVLLAGMGYFLT
ncbi:MAG: aa3-type cytochrome c oxidase subunit IV [Hyphomicrobium sp.]|nr:MAG: aa3-type cytochrome c oxidase subunit IV [Hyphomicrobium sp.]MBZ0211288.1 aa3-type cytochrome c oxidase subunit IV [Hyphomicrobium sp.]